MHALREPLGTVAIRLALLDDEAVSDAAREHLEAMLTSVHRMMKALSAITELFGLEAGSATPLAILTDQRRPVTRAPIKVRQHESDSSREAG